MTCFVYSCGVLASLLQSPCVCYVTRLLLVLDFVYVSSVHEMPRWPAKHTTVHPHMYSVRDKRSRLEEHLWSSVHGYTPPDKNKLGITGIQIVIILLLCVIFMKVDQACWFWCGPPTQVYTVDNKGRRLKLVLIPGGFADRLWPL